MKKLMIAAAIVCAAAFAQASTVNWSLDGDILTGDPTEENYTFGDQFLVLLGTTGSTTGLGIDTDGNLVLGEGMTLAKDGPGAIADGYASTMQSVVNANDLYYALVLADETTHQWTVLTTQSAGVKADDDRDQVSISFGTSGANLTNDPVTVPEPTSGLLLLLGVAGLALKRRRA